MPLFYGKGKKGKEKPANMNFIAALKAPNYLTNNI